MCPLDQLLSLAERLRLSRVASIRSAPQEYEIRVTLWWTIDVCPTVKC